ncbi:sugar transporter [Plasmopara halstedii]|uniref:Hexose transporter 1 n=1 Tax=Plasmopara halstedii TaxID=4781 RepID=A0A0P1AD38_PLAHL|nr:sugar transporter [Plasmopara halstedii]CEG38916.1 sugar transporter [Plasmopara halstedii]|eukprot:XP_024575285.1 sugar transporter [Plasmopara halstedii]
MHDLKYYVEEQKRLYQELPFRVIPGMRTRSFRSERDFPQLQSRGSWANLSRLIIKHGERKPLLEDEDGAVMPGYTNPLLVSCMVAVINAFQYGYNTAVTGAMDSAVVFPGHSNFMWALCVSSFAVGGPIGSLVGGRLNTFLGRRKTMLATSCLFILSGAVMAFAMNMSMLIVGRFLVGIASGTATVIVPLYLGELAPPNLRGALGTTYQLAMVLGILCTILIAFGFANESTSLAHPGWRFMFGFAGLLGVVQVGLMSFLVESPRWLLNNGDEKEAEVTLRYLRQLDDVFDELDSISAASFRETGDGQGISQVLRDENIRLPLLVAITLQLAQQLSGINAVMFYASSFFQNAGLEDPRFGITLVYIINVMATIVALMLMDSAGRRPLLLWSIMGMLVSSGILTLGLLDVLPFGSLFSVGGVMSFVWFFEIGLGPIPWLIAAEMFPPRSRTTATSIATMVNWFGLFLIGIFFPTMQRELEDEIFVPFAILLALAFAFSLKFVPETKGKTVEEIQDDVNKK